MHRTIKENTSYELVEKKSKFIANLIYIETKEQAEKIIAEHKKKYFDARHNCYAYRVLSENEIYEKSSDDGEPSGTAGTPILNVLQKNDLCNVIIIVTRYFGGILLGTGGLVRAYSNASIEAVEKAELAYIEMGVEYKIEIDYATLKSLQYYCKNNDMIIKNCEYSENIICCVQMNREKENQFLKEINIKKIHSSNPVIVIK